MQKDNLVYVGHMIDLAKKARSFIEGLNREDFDSDELLRLSLTDVTWNSGHEFLAASTAGLARGACPYLNNLNFL
jgi:hypothetical protein